MGNDGWSWITSFRSFCVFSVCVSHRKKYFDYQTVKSWQIHCQNEHTDPKSCRETLQQTTKTKKKLFKFTVNRDKALGVNKVPGRLSEVIHVVMLTPHYQQKLEW